MIRLFNITPMSVAVVLSLTSMAAAGSGNVIYLEQGDGTSVGNQLFINQSNATSSLVAGASGSQTPARQQGNNNSGRIVLEGEGAAVYFNQNSSLAGVLQGNSATISGGDLASIVLNQAGAMNIGTISVTGVNNSAGLRQEGDGNNGSVEVSGSNNSGTLIQEGNQNSFSLTVGGASTNVTYRQIGNGLSTVTGTGPTVVSNGGTVVITQTQ
ncbi:hypothetical protein PXK58_18990 [Phaeobacter gallaeciensis]|uniref:hypothetical protein n=1 Tax=Phaeobacter gallaeciensis TaxID=60890 RepID=UPI0023806878|nr:hypothetical protein [Phaeobacter gallaeciensis]MDE4276374.1 hypothetical protein [Phaeobacter gallaeciensis]MDE4301647.1 hypothetical protein [Phaeobacter gallaeciensis]MDE5186802.1 hypothetical protein [Phaeobacter gallaeciensis]